MAEQPIISVSGLRGIIGSGLTPTVAARYAAAFAAELGRGKIVISRDGRATGRMLADAIRSTLQAVGRQVLDADVAATPTLGILVRETEAAGGIQISASHNPPEYNGMKLFGADGRVLPAEIGQQVLRRYREEEISWVPHTHVGSMSCEQDPHGPHLQRVLQIVDGETIKSQRFRVLLDSNHGAGGLLGSRLLESLGCEVHLVAGEPTGHFAHPPEPTAENLAGVATQVRDGDFVVGFCQDPDADRLALIDEHGSYVGEEYTLALCVDHVLRQSPGVVVTNCSTSRMTEDLADKYQVPFFRAKVGEAHVADVMLAQQAVFGGEGNGGPIDPRVGYVRDSFVGMALVLDAMALRNQSLSALAGELPRYEIHKTKIQLAGDQLAPALKRLEQHFSAAKCSRMDGLRLDFPGKWLLVRASNTEPIVRLIAEAPTQQEAQQLCDEASRVI